MSVVHRASRTLAASFLCLVPACATVLDFKEPTDAPASQEGCACVPAAPADWDGPLAFYEGSGGPPPPVAPACAGAYPTVAFDGTAGIVAPAARCGCSCGEANGMRCDPPKVSFFKDSGCTVPCGTPDQPIAAGPTCTPLAIAGCSGTHFSVKAGGASGGACPPSPTRDVPPSGWSITARLCRLPAPASRGACEEGRVCAAPTALPFAPNRFCIARPGSWQCPAEYPDAHTYHHGATDTRDCSACTCEPPAGATCSATTLATYDRADCTGGEKKWAPPRACDKIESAHGLSTPGTPAGVATCAPRGGAPTGDVVPTTPTTVCCSS